MSDYRDEFNDDNGTVADGNQDNNSSENKINGGAIRKSTTQSILNALGHASGQSFESVEAALAFVARTSAGASQNVVGNEQPVERSQQRSGRVTTNDLHEQFSRLQQDLAVKEQRLREKELDGDIMKSIGDRFDSDLMDYALQKIKSNIQWNDDGTYSIVNNKGQERYGTDGNPLSISGLINEVAKGNPKLLKQGTGSGGSGLRPGQGQFAGAPDDVVPDYSKDPAAFNAWASRNGLGKNIGLKATGVTASVSGLSRKVL